MKATRTKAKWLTPLSSSKYFWLFLLLLGGCSALYFSSNNKDLPAWIQAVGSVLAIIGAFWVSDSERSSEHLQRRQSIFAVAEAAHAFSQKIRNAVDASDVEAAIANPILSMSIYDRSITDGFAGALGNIPFHEVGTPDAVQALLSMQGRFAKFLPSSIEVFIAGPQNHPKLKDKIHEYDALDQPERSRKQRELRTIQFKALAYNIRVHLDQIDADFKILEAAYRG